MGTLTLRKLARTEVEFIVSIEAEDTDYRNEFDDPLAVAIIADRLARGEVEAWCTVKVTAQWGTFTASDYLGGCSLDSNYTAAVAANEHGMQEEALSRLNQALQDVATALAPLKAQP